MGVQMTVDGWEHLVHQVRHVDIPDMREYEGAHDEKRERICDLITYDDL